MTAQELIAQLQKLPPKTQVCCEDCRNRDPKFAALEASPTGPADAPKDYEAPIYEAIGRYAVKSARWIRHEHEHYAAVPVAFGANLDSAGMRFDALKKAAGLAGPADAGSHEPMLALAREIGDVIAVAQRRSDPDREHRQMISRLEDWRKRILAASASAPAAPTCDCGAVMTQCSSCAVADWQAAHPECRTCCPASAPAAPQETP